MSHIGRNNTRIGGPCGVLFQDMLSDVSRHAYRFAQGIVRCMSKRRVIVEAVLAGKSQRGWPGSTGSPNRESVSSWQRGGPEAGTRGTAVPAAALQPEPNTTGSGRSHPRLAPSPEQRRMRRWPHSIAAILDDELAIAPSVTTIWRILTHARRYHRRTTQTPPKRSSIPLRRRPTQRECWQADFTHIRLADGTDTECDLPRRPLPLPDLGHPLTPSHRRHRGPDRVRAPAPCTASRNPPDDNRFVFTTRFRSSPNRSKCSSPTRRHTKNGSRSHPRPGQSRTTEPDPEEVARCTTRGRRRRRTTTPSGPLLTRLLQPPPQTPIPQPPHPRPGLPPHGQSHPDPNSRSHYRIPRRHRPRLRIPESHCVAPDCMHRIKLGADHISPPSHAHPTYTSS